jgi:hypothetical protein
VAEHHTAQEGQDRRDGPMGRYLYAITRGIDPAVLDGVTGIDAVPVTVVEHRDLQAVVGDVPLAEFGEEGLRRNLERLDWLEQTARAHDDVVHQVAALGPIAPLRLATICLDDAGVRARLDEWRHALQMALDRVEGREEWSVKGFVQRQAPERPDPTAGEGTAGSSSGAAARRSGAGAAYLQRKKTETQDRQHAQERAAEEAATIHAGLCDGAVAARRLQPQDPRLTGHQGTMTLNAAYLVPREEVDGFLARVRELAERHPDTTLEVGGPWPPYSFATLEQR